MALIGYHCSHEQYTPSQLRRYVQQAEAAGFQAAMASDHFMPWSERQGQSGFMWSWLGAAMQTTELSFGMVCAPGQRYHPAIIAQAAATLSEMFPGRLWCAFGSGQQLNEHITGAEWPHKEARNARLKEAVEVIRALWAGETVNHSSEHFTVMEAYLYTRPAQPPMVVGAAITPGTAAWMAPWVDGIVTVHKPCELQREFVAAFRENGGADKPMFLQAQTSFERDEEAALHGAHDQWRNNIFQSRVLSELRLPAQFDAAGELVRPEDLHGHIRISADVQRHIDWIGRDIELGFDRLYLHNVNREQDYFIETFGEKVLPVFKEVAASER